MKEFSVDPALYPLVGAMGGAFIAALAAFLTSMLSKELKTSEFRYSWLNSVLDDTAEFLGAAQRIRANSSGNSEDGDELAEGMAAYYRVRIRLYPDKHAAAIQSLDSLRSSLTLGRAADAAIYLGLAIERSDAMPTALVHFKKGAAIRKDSARALGEMILATQHALMREELEG